MSDTLSVVKAPLVWTGYTKLLTLPYGGHKVSRAEFEQDLHEKRKDSAFISDFRALLPEGADDFKPQNTFDEIEKKLIYLILGQAWKGKKEQSSKR